VSVVIFFGLVVMWAVVLIPMWLKRHDEAEESRSVDRFTSAMHTLSRRQEPSEARYVVMPHRSRSVEVHVSGASAPTRRERRRALAARRAATRRPVTAATRRRRSLLGLLVLAALTFAAAMFLGGLRMWAPQFVLDALLIAFVVHLVMRGRQATAVRAAPAAQRRAAPRRAAPASAPIRRAAPAPAPAVEPARVAPAVPRREPLFDQTAVAVAPLDLEWTLSDPLFDQSADVDLVAAERAVASEQVAQAPTIDLPAYEDELPGRDEEPQLEIGGRPWEPVPVPRPTYATKPAAPTRAPQAPIFEPLLPPVETPAELDPADDLEEILDRRWAVND
jgi:hypothetical protein